MKKADIFPIEITYLFSDWAGKEHGPKVVDHLPSAWIEIEANWFIIRKLKGSVFVLPSMICNDRQLTVRFQLVFSRTLKLKSIFLALGGLPIE